MKQWVKDMMSVRGQEVPSRLDLVFITWIDLSKEIPLEKVITLFSRWKKGAGMNGNLNAKQRWLKRIL